MSRIDSKDFKIMLQLDRNARTPLQEIAKAVQMPIETVRYRIERLISDGVIQNFITVIDGGRLGYYYYKVFVRLQNVNERSLQTFVSALVDNPQICWVVRVDGNFDVAFTPRVTSPLEQSRLMDELRSRFSAQISRWTLSVNIRMHFFARDFWVGSSERKGSLGSYSVAADPYQPDATEKLVLEQLSASPRESASEIARRIGSSVDSVLLRIRRLEQERVIVRYMSVADNEKIPQVNFYVLVYFNSLTAKRENEFLKFCAKQPNIVYLIKSLGAWDYELSIEAFKIEDYRSLMMKLTNEFSDVIAEYHGMPVSRIHRYVYP